MKKLYQTPIAGGNAKRCQENYYEGKGLNTQDSYTR